MPPTDEMWLRLTYWLANDPGLIPEELVGRLMERYPAMTENQAWTSIARFRNERHTIQEQK
jgi:hypothetical protein